MFCFATSHQASLQALVVREERNQLQRYRHVWVVAIGPHGVAADFDDDMGSYVEMCNHQMKKSGEDRCLNWKVTTIIDRKDDYLWEYFRETNRSSTPRSKEGGQAPPQATETKT